jgi:hypothetical protein
MDNDHQTTIDAPQKRNGCPIVAGNPGNALKKRTPEYTQYLDAQQLGFDCLRKLKIDIAFLSSRQSVSARDERRQIARAIRDAVLAMDTAAERLRILRGIPDPGRLQPDMDPIKYAKRLKQRRKQGLIEVGSQVHQGIEEEGIGARQPAEKPVIEARPAAGTGEAKESL